MLAAEVVTAAVAIANNVSAAHNATTRSSTFLSIVASMFAATIVATSIAASRGQPDFTSLCIALYPSFASAYGVPPLMVASISAGTGATASVANGA